jgi:hypothetical protein
MPIMTKPNIPTPISPATEQNPTAPFTNKKK